MADAQDPRAELSTGIELSGSVVTFLIGEDKQKCYVHRTLLEDDMDLLKQMSLDPEAKQYSLPKIDLAAFQYYIEYLYTGKFTRCVHGAEDEWLGFVKVCSLAQDLRHPKLQDAAVNAILSVRAAERSGGSSILPGCGTIEAVYEQDTGDSKLKQLFVDMYLWDAGYSKYDEDLNMIDLPSAFASDLLRAAFAKMRAGCQVSGMPESVSCCDYHQHEPGAQCSHKKRKRDVADVGAK